jgi:hypothetical protein
MVNGEHPVRPPARPEDRFLSFTAGSRRYAIALAHVTGLADCGPVRAVAGTPPEVLGLTEWRGRLLTVLDLTGLLGEDETQEPMCLIRLAGTMTRTAFRVPAPVTLLTGEEVNGAVEQEANNPRYTMVDPAELVSQLEAEILAGDRQGEN